MEPGSYIGDYEVLEVIGAGGMGKVYKVRNRFSERVEAIKILLPALEGDADLTERFLREIKVQAAMDHPNITKLHTAFRHEGRLVMVMEYVEGTPLEELLGKGPLPLQDALRYCSQVLDALAYAHERGVVHRDLKPSNIMLTAGGAVKLMDFGIARLTQDRTKLTQTGRTLGSLFYMSPEQIRGDRDIDGRSDLYSLGVTLYELVTGRRPFSGDSEYSIMAAHLQQAPVPPVEVDPRVPKPLSDVILMAIDKDPSRRFQSADAMKNALAGVAQMLGLASAQNAAGTTVLANAAAAVPSGPPVSPGGKAAAAPAQTVGAPVPEPRRRGGSARILWVAAGSLLTIAVLVFAALQLPRWFGVGAAPGKLNRDLAMPQTAVQARPTGGSAQEIPPAAAQSSTHNEVGAGSAEIQAGALPRGVSSAREASAARAQRQPEAAAVGNRASAASSGQPPVAPPSPAAAGAARPPAAPAATPADSGEIAALRDRMMMMATRISAVTQSLDRLQREQARMGLGLRGDMVSARQRMELLMDNAEAALRRGEAGDARQQLDRAERELEKLEKFLNL